MEGEGQRLPLPTTEELKAQMGTASLLQGCCKQAWLCPVASQAAPSRPGDPLLCWVQEGS